MTRVAILGLGDAGGRYFRGLTAAGATVRGFDPFAEPADGVRREDDVAATVAGAEIVLSLVGAHAAVAAATTALPLLEAGAIYADMNTASREVKTEVAAQGRRHARSVVDVAVLAPVHRAAERTPLLVTGDDAHVFARAFTVYGAPVETHGGVVGDAAELKLLRSVFMKGLSALVIESLDTARALGAEDWLRGQIASELAAPGAGEDATAAVRHLVDGAHKHAARREREVRDALSIVESTGLPADMTRATLVWAARILARRE